jgi:ankyrin repeat protein
MTRGTWILVVSVLCAGTAAGAASASRASAEDSLEAARLAVRTKQFGRALELLRAPANRERPEAQYLLGLALWNGVGLPPDRQGAVACLRFAAGKGHGAAAYALAALLSRGTSKERAEAASWRRRALDAGYAPALDPRLPDALPLADPRGIGADTELRLQIARFAARHDDVELLRATDPRGLVALRGPFGRTLLAEAAEAGAFEALQSLLAAGAVAEVADDVGITPLMLASSAADPRSSQRLITAGARVNAVDANGRTSLMHAAAANKPAQIGALLAAGAVLAQVDAQGYSATDIAAQREATDALRVLRAAGGTVTRLAAPANRGVDASRGGLLYEGWAPLLVAVARNDAADIRRRLAAGERLDVRTPRGASALQVAVESRAVDAAAALLAAGADARRPDRDGLSARARVVSDGDIAMFEVFFGAAAGAAAAPDAAEAGSLLMHALERRELEMARRLLAWGANPRAPDKNGLTPLHRAAQSGDAVLLKLLLDRGADAAALDAHGRSALWYAVAARSPEAVNVLLSVNAASAAADREGVAPLMLAARGGDEASLRRLLAIDSGRDPAAQGASLRVAAALARSGIVELLLAGGANLDSADEFGDTPLMAAARAGHAGICSRLLAAGANPRLRNRDRATAADLAELRGFQSLAKQLRP